MRTPEQVKWDFVQQWLDKARKDLATAEILLPTRHTRSYVPAITGLSRCFLVYPSPPVTRHAPGSWPTITSTSTITAPWPNLSGTSHEHESRSRLSVFFSKRACPIDEEYETRPDPEDILKISLRIGTANGTRVGSATALRRPRCLAKLTRAGDLPVGQAVGVHREVVC